MEDRIEALAREVETLKTSNRRMKRWGGLALLLALGAGVTAMAQEEKVPEVIRAKKFDIIFQQVLT